MILERRGAVGGLLAAGASCWRPNYRCKEKFNLRRQFSPKTAGNTTRARSVTPQTKFPPQNCGYPRHVVCAWLGNTEAIASKHYLMVTDEDFAKAAQKTVPPEPETSQHAAAASTHGNEETPGNAGETCVSSILSGAPKAEDTGLEPAAPYGVPQFQ